MGRAVKSSDKSRHQPVLTALGLLILVGLLVGGGYAVYVGVRDAPSVVGALVTALGAVLAVVAGRIYETRMAIEQARRERMAPIYERLFETFYSGASGKEVAEEEMQAFFEQLAQRLIVWGPTPVIHAFTKWKNEVQLHEGSPQALFEFEKLLLAMRLDLGTKSSDLASGDLLRVFINDVDDHLPAPESGEQRD